MNIIIFGAGYVGLTVAACLYKDGHTIYIQETDQYKSELLLAGGNIINESGVDTLLAKGILEQNILVNYEFNSTLAKADLIFVCVGTPLISGEELDLTGIITVSNTIAQSLSSKGSRVNKGLLPIVYRSTIPPGTIENKVLPIFEVYKDLIGEVCEIAFNPEFMREGTAMADYYSPPKIVLGERFPGATKRLLGLYNGISASFFEVNYKTAEFIKLVDNTWHGMKVAFANEIGRISKSCDTSPSLIFDLFLADNKLNISPYYLRPGGAFGGSCLPKDIKATIGIAKKNNVEVPLISSLLTSNNFHKDYLLSSILDQLPKIHSVVLLIGLSFKSGTDDLRDSPLLELANNLTKLGVNLKIYDPDIMLEHDINMGARPGYKSNLNSLELISRQSALSNSFDAIVIGKHIANLDEFLGLGSLIINLYRL